MLHTVEKAGQVLNLFTPERPEWGVSQVAAELDLPKSSAHALLSSLTQVGLLYRMMTGRYRLGFRILTLSQALLHNTPWREVAREEMERLRARFGETVHLGVLAGGEVVSVIRLGGTRADAAEVMPMGSVLPPHCSAHGKILLAERPWTFVEGVLERHGMSAYTPNTITAPDELASELARVRERGYAYDIEEVRSGLCCVSAPVRNHNGETIVAVGVAVPPGRFHQHKTRLREAVIEAGKHISERIGYNPEFAEAGRYWWASIDGRDELQPARQNRRDAPRRKPRQKAARPQPDPLK
ncbi:IclR family transcriptional regulator (plasmid) [Deinococcus metallilatus]|uniref:DNA-binding IclR family transcriptional regulator n=1 Tax=Deinococcus metallilatus TaxID=1211322 RepID=A0ABR6MNN4_9DEIO|nr:IclR family transcriptional regulator [Deinococcus metallilatus]MBB5293555.1 DNA-binding IclR family transcriptional regulator [Deinococcus metallilatus]QBY06626.1 IclR family transcriptional regulator [Deinococcus metallilatus]RXJ17969.1 IclR family transcriptional regulator [Deinococcus metallilatus]GMA15225.1 IclR family transcriptional regulator [Deinococcus metallilatus]